MDVGDRRSRLDGTVLDRWVNPATIRGSALVLVGFVVLALPELSVSVIRLLLVATLVVLGAMDLWAAIRNPETPLSNVLLGIAAVAAGVAMVVLGGDAVSFLVRVTGVWMVVRGAIIAVTAMRNRFSERTWVFDLVRGMLTLGVGAVLIAVPESLVDAVVIVAALTAIVVGGIVISFGVTHDDELDLGAGELGGLVVRWFRRRDVGDEMRADVVDNLFFEPPDALQKQIGFWTLLVLSVVIATLGVLADSTAVVIGAMLVAPLMTPIMGVSAAIVNGWTRRLVAAFATVVGGVAVAIGVAFIVAVWTPRLVPLASNSQILSRTSPTLIDLMIAMAAGAAGAYATVDKRVSSSITGVAIAVALVPPLGVVGVMLQATEWSDALGAFLLFLTNFVSIVLVASIVFLVTGLAPFTELRANHQKMRTVIVTVALATLVIMVPLTFTSNGILASATRQSTTQDTVEEWLGDSDLQLNRVSIATDEVEVVLSGEGSVPSVAELDSALEEALGVEVTVLVEYFPSTIVTSESQESG